MNDLNDFLKFAEIKARQVGKMIKNKEIRFESLDFHDQIDFSTKYDVESEQFLLDAIQEQYPKHGFYGEEIASARDTSKEYVWFVDPIDGTKYYGKNVPFYTTVISLVHNGDPIIGVVYDPVSDQLFSAAKGTGSFLNGKRIPNPSKKYTLSESILAIELGDQDLESEMNLLTSIYKQSGRIRVMGNASLSLCWSALDAFQGYIDLFGMFEVDKAQDIYAPLLIAQESGLTLKTFEYRGRKKLMCVRAELVETIEAILQDSR